MNSNHRIYDLLIVFFAVLTIALSGLRARTEKNVSETVYVVQPNTRSPASLSLKKVKGAAVRATIGGDLN